MDTVLETWTLNSQLEDKIESFEMCLYKRNGRIGKQNRTMTNLTQKLRMERKMSKTRTLCWTYKETVQSVENKEDNITTKDLATRNVSTTTDDVNINPDEPSLTLSRQSTAVQETIRLNSKGPEVDESDPLNSSQIQQNASRVPQRSDAIILPGIYTYLPHIGNNKEYLIPAVKVSQNRTGVELVIGIPTVYRPKDVYLTNTLDSLLNNLQTSHAINCLIIVFIAEAKNMSFVENLTTALMKKYSVPIASGLIDIIAPKSEFYPSMDGLPLTFDDSEERVRWRTKQNLDYAYLMLHAYSRGHFYIQLEDDVITKPDFYVNIMTALKLRGHDWIVLKFSPLGFIGKLFHTSDLPFIAEFLLMFYSDKPGDWLLDNIMTTKICGKNMHWKDCLFHVKKISIDIRPSLFQHVGLHSSLKGKIQLLKDKSFRFNPRARLAAEIFNTKVNLNPTPTNIETSIKVYRRQKIEYAYVGRGFFWGLTPVIDDVIDFIYEPPIKIASYKLVSGDINSPSDIFPEDTTVEVLVVNNSTIEQNKNVTASRKFQVIGHFNSVGTAEGDVPVNISSVGIFRIHVNSDMSTWVILSQISINLE